MIIEHVKTRRRYEIMPETWNALNASGKSETYQIIDNIPQVPKEVKNVRRKSAESEINDNTANTDRLPEQDPGEIE